MGLEKVRKYVALAAGATGEDKEFYSMMARHFLKLYVLEGVAELGNYSGELILWEQ